MLCACDAGTQSDGFFTKPGEEFPRFQMTDTDGTPFNLEKLQGKPSLILLFGTRCPPCLQEIKRLSEVIDKDWRNRYNIIVFGSTDDREELAWFKEKHGYDFDFIPDGDQYLFHAIAKSSIPRMLLLDDEGIIKSQSYGYTPRKLDHLLSKMKRLL